MSDPTTEARAVAERLVERLCGIGWSISPLRATSFNVREESIKWAARALDAFAAEAVAREREACAMIAKRSNFVDGPDGTIEGQIAVAIRARKGKP